MCSCTLHVVDGVSTSHDHNISTLDARSTSGSGSHGWEAENTHSLPRATQGIWRPDVCPGEVKPLRLGQEASQVQYEPSPFMANCHGHRQLHRNYM